MVSASFVQSSFLGGAWSTLAQGRMDDEKYKTALNVCHNSFPLEEGCWTRRQGTEYITHTKLGNPARLMGFDFSIVAPYQMEFTDGFLRFFRGTSIVFTDDFGIINVSEDNPAEVTTAGNHNWATGDTVMFFINTVPPSAPNLTDRQFVITVTADNKFTIVDALTGDAIDGSTLAWLQPQPGDQSIVARILELETPYVNGDWARLRKVQDDTTCLLLHTAYQPEVVTNPNTFDINPVDFEDGPYLDINTTATTIGLSGLTGSVTVTANSETGINNDNGFAVTDVGRLLRYQSAPASWSSLVTYAKAAIVLGSDNNIYSSVTGGNINHNPTTDTGANWEITTQTVVWTWLQITAFTDATHVTATIMGDDVPSDTATTVWRLGVYSDTTGWPTCGCYHEGRLCLFGVVPNRGDLSVSGDHFNFAPTGSDGTVADDNAVAFTMTATEVNAVFWAASTDQGIIIGTQAGEWRIRSTTIDDPITPSNVQARRVSTFGSFEAEVAQTPRALTYIQRQQRKVIEFGFSQYTGAYGASIAVSTENLSLKAADKTITGLQEIAFQNQPTPIIWGRRTDGTLVGCSYQHDNDKFYSAWHDHALGSERLVESISAGPRDGGLTDALYLVTNDPNTGLRWVETLTDIFDDNKADWQAWFVDGGVTPSQAQIYGNQTGIEFYGLWHLNGETIQPFVGGLDLGNYTVGNGTIQVPFGADPDGLFTLTFLNNINAEGINFGDYNVNIEVGSSPLPVPIVGAFSIMGYVGTDSAVTGVTGSAAIPDYTNGFLYLFKEGNHLATGPGIRQYQLDPTGDDLYQLARTAIGATAISTNSGGAAALVDDHLLFISDDPSNTVQSEWIHASEGVFGGFFGISSNSVAASFNLYPYVYTPMLCGSAGDWFLTTPSERATGLLTAERADFASGINFGATDEQATRGVSFCTGRNGGGWGSAYAMARPVDYSSIHSTAAVGFYVLTNAAFDGSVAATNKIGTLSPAQVDATWTHFSGVVGMAFDQTDGNLIINVATDDAVSQLFYIVKINANTAAVMWTCPVGTIDAFGDQNWSRHSIKNQTMFFVEGGGNVLRINTATGVATTTTVTGLTLTGGHVSEDTNYSVIMFGDFSNSGAGQPAYIGSYMGTGGNHTLSSEWMRLFFGGNPGTEYITDVAAAAIGFTYTSQAQLLRPDYGNDAGARNGPAFGKKRRVHQYVPALYRTQKFQIGNGFVDPYQLADVPIVTEGNEPILPPTLFTGVLSGTNSLFDDYSFEGKIAWQITRPYPCTVTAMGGYIESSDK